MGLGQLPGNTNEKAYGQGREPTILITTNQPPRIPAHSPGKKQRGEKRDGTMIKVIEHKWKAKLDSGQETNVTEEFVSANFGERFKNELK